MNTVESEIISTLFACPNLSFSELSKKTGYSKSLVQKTCRKLADSAQLSETKTGWQLKSPNQPSLKLRKPKNAIILAAGLGIGMVPLHREIPKAFLQVKGEKLIERLIRQLHEAKIFDITVVCGFMKEKFNNLIDDFGVKLAINARYRESNNLHSLALVQNLISDTYILPCHLYFHENPFRQAENHSWYLLCPEKDSRSLVRVNRKFEVCKSKGGGEAGNRMTGIAFICQEKAKDFCDTISSLIQNPQYDFEPWETALLQRQHEKFSARLISSKFFHEINDLQDLRKADDQSTHLKHEIIVLLSQVLQVPESEIQNPELLKHGMTNDCFIFTCQDKRYIMRIPGEGTDNLINRHQEAAAYRQALAKNICEPVLYLNPENGYKITEFIENARVCDANNTKDVADCLKTLKKFHSYALEVSHIFDIFERLDYYEKLWGEKDSLYSDYVTTKANILSLKPYIDEHAAQFCLCHIDPVPDNFLFVPTANGGEQILLIDWEYAAMQDPHLDIAMFCIYSLYDKQNCDRAIDFYFDNSCPKEIRLKIYAYIATCGLLWSNWCEYKYHLGVEFGEYSLRQYRYAKDFYRYFHHLKEEE